jgi:hypothetical protein
LFTSLAGSCLSRAAGFAERAVSSFLAGSASGRFARAGLRKGKTGMRWFVTGLGDVADV